MTRFVFFLLLILKPLALAAQGLEGAVDSYLIELKISAIVFLLDVILIFWYVIGKNKTLATFLHFFGGAFVIYGIITIIKAEGFLLIMLPGMVFMLFGIFSILIPLLRKRV